MLPKLLAFSEPEWIKLQRVSGVPYLGTEFEPVLLAETLASFHGATFNGEKCFCQMDNQPQNILLCEDRYYLLDFAEGTWDYPEFDLCHLLLFWASDLPQAVFNAKARTFLCAYHAVLPLREWLWKACLNRSIDKFDSRRKLYNKSFGKNPIPSVLSNRTTLSNLSSLLSPLL